VSVTDPTILFTFEGVTNLLMKHVNLINIFEKRILGSIEKENEEEKGRDREKRKEKK